MSKESLSALVDIQKSITKRESFEEVLALIADRARIVAGATGIAIGFLTGHQLVFRAGSGSAARCVGQHLTAVLSLPAHRGARREILRVENADADARIEAAVCREREARALLIIPIYRKQVVVGVLEVLFSNPHAFDDRELRTYRLIAGLVEEAMCDDTYLGEKASPATQPPTPTVPHSVEQPFSVQEFSRGDKPDTKPCIAQVSGPLPTIGRTASTLCPPARDQKTLRQPAKLTLFNDPHWTLDAALVLIILGLAAWISIHHRVSPRIEYPTSVNASIPLAKPSATIFRKARGSKEKASGKTESASRARSAFTRVRVGPNEVDYIAEDVTIRHFTTTATSPLAPAVNKQFDIGDDVTVRIFPKAPAVAAQTRTVSRR